VLLPGAKLPEMFAAETKESQMFLKMITDNMDDNGFKGTLTMPNDHYVYLYSIKPIIINGTRVGYISAGGDFRFYVGTWSKLTDGCYGFWNNHEDPIPEAVTKDGVDDEETIYFDIRTVTVPELIRTIYVPRSTLRYNFTPASRRICSEQTILTIATRENAMKSDDIRELGPVYTKLYNSLPDAVKNTVNTTLPADEAEVARKIMDNGTYLRIEYLMRVIAHGRNFAIRFYEGATTIMAVTLFAVYLYILFAVLLRLNTFTRSVMETLLDTFEELNGPETFGKNQRREVIEEVMKQEDDIDGDEIKICTALAKYLGTLQQSKVQEELNTLYELQDQNRILLDTYRLVNMFVGREDDEIKGFLPGLVDNSQENMKRSTLRQMMNGALVMKKPVEFKTLKQILSNSIATLVFKAYCRRCGLDAYQSFMFLIDIVWLRCIELGAIDKVQDFASVAARDNDKTRLMFSGLDAPDELSDDTGSVIGLVGQHERTSSFGSDSTNSQRRSLPPNGVDGVDSIPRETSKRSFFKSRNNVGVDTTRQSLPMSPLASPTAGQGSPLGSPIIGPSSPRFNRKQIAFSKQLAWTPESTTDFQKSLSSLPPIGGDSLVEKSMVNIHDPMDRVKVLFQTEMGKAFAKTMYQAYFGEKSLAQRYKGKSALLGCGKSKEYKMLRDSQEVVLTPKILETLAENVTKRLNADVLSKFQQSFMYKVVVMICDAEQEIGKKRVQENSTSSPALEPGPNSFRATPIFRNIWNDVCPTHPNM